MALDVIYTLLIDDTVSGYDMDKVREVIDGVIDEPVDPEEAMARLVEEWGTSAEAIANAESDFWDAE